MRKKIKGFTLIECIVALAVLGIASLTMAQIYAAVAQRNRMNHLVNTSLSNQMAYVEKYTNSEAVKVAYGGSTAPKPPKPASSTGSITNKDFYIELVHTHNSGVTRDGLAFDDYSFPVDIYVLKSRNSKDQTLDKTRHEMYVDAQGQNVDLAYYNVADVGNTGGYGEAEYNLRYKYVLGHK